MDFISSCRGLRKMFVVSRLLFGKGGVGVPQWFPFSTAQIQNETGRYGGDAEILRKM